MSILPPASRESVPVFFRPLGLALLAFVLLPWRLCLGAPADSPYAQFEQLERRVPMTWMQTESLRVFGLPAYRRAFRAAEPLHRAAELLGAHTVLFQQMLAFKNKVVLSGARRGWHWVAEIDAAGARGVLGVISALAHHGQYGHGLQAERRVLAAWIPADARLLLSHGSRSREHEHLLQIYLSPWSRERLLAHVRRELKSAGWRQDVRHPELAGLEIWRLRRGELNLSSAAVAQGTALVVEHISRVS